MANEAGNHGNSANASLPTWPYVYLLLIFMTNKISKSTFLLRFCFLKGCFLFLFWLTHWFWTLFGASCRSNYVGRTAQRMNFRMTHKKIFTWQVTADALETNLILTLWRGGISGVFCASRPTNLDHFFDCNPNTNVWNASVD